MNQDNFEIEYLGTASYNDKIYVITRVLEMLPQEDDEPEEIGQIKIGFRGKGFNEYFEMTPEDFVKLSGIHFFRN